MTRVAVYAAAALAAAGLSVLAAVARPDSAEQTMALDGAALFSAKGCASCHDGPDSTSLTDAGPPLVAASAWAGERVDGLSAEEYLEQSMRNPSAFISPLARSGDGMPLLQLSDDEIDALVDHLLHDDQLE
jgi:mono/diheme cytochrome c family protein